MDRITYVFKPFQGLFPRLQVVVNFPNVAQVGRHIRMSESLKHVGDVALVEIVHGRDHLLALSLRGGLFVLAAGGLGKLLESVIAEKSKRLVFDLFFRFLDNKDFIFKSTLYPKFIYKA